MGFISRDDVATKLKDAHEGSAIIRFSESRIDHDSGGANPYAALNVGFRYVNREKGNLDFECGMINNSERIRLGAIQ